LYAEWEKAQKEAQALGRLLNQKVNSKLSVADGKLLFQFWMATKDSEQIARAVARNPAQVDFTALVDSELFDSVVRFTANWRTEWPKEAVPAFKRYLGSCHHRSYVVQHVLHRLAQEEDFKLCQHRHKIVQHGTLKLCCRLIEDEEENKHLQEEDWSRLVARFKDAKPDYENRHPLATLVKAKGVPDWVVDGAVTTFLEDGHFHPACSVVKSTKRDDLIPQLEEQALQFKDLYKIQDFLKEFPQADKEKFRDIVRKMLVPDPEDMIEAFLNGRGSRRDMMIAMYGPGPFICGPLGHHRWPWLR